MDFSTSSRAEVQAINSLVQSVVLDLTSWYALDAGSQWAGVNAYWYRSLSHWSEVHVTDSVPLLHSAMEMMVTHKVRAHMQLQSLLIVPMVLGSRCIPLCRNTHMLSDQRNAWPNNRRKDLRIPISVSPASEKRITSGGHQPSPWSHYAVPLAVIARWLWVTVRD